MDEKAHELVFYEVEYGRPCYLFQTSDGTDADKSWIQECEIHIDYAVYICLCGEEVRDEEDGPAVTWDVFCHAGTGSGTWFVP